MTNRVKKVNKDSQIKQAHFRAKAIERIPVKFCIIMSCFEPGSWATPWLFSGLNENWKNKIVPMYDDSPQCRTLIKSVIEQMKIFDDEAKQILWNTLTKKVEQVNKYLNSLSK